ncbi:MAG: hypothetical protein MJA29_02800 [Candidatus Omnitrophica bacterium]|nr:hypothetical protein [Candidatus Omnitrophota bacterium]
MRLAHNTISYDLEEAIQYLKEILRRVENKSITEEEFLFEMKHVFLHLNFAVNARHLTRKTVTQLSQEKFESLRNSSPFRIQLLRKKKTKDCRQRGE